MIHPWRMQRLSVPSQKESLLKLRLLEPHCGNRDMINVTDSLKTNYTHKMIF